jgi:hypothetical protein
MDEYESLSHSRWECKYHVVFIPKCRRKVLYGQLRKHLGEVFRKLAEQKWFRNLQHEPRVRERRGRLGTLASWPSDLTLNALSPPKFRAQARI